MTRFNRFDQVNDWLVAKPKLSDSDFPLIVDTYAEVVRILERDDSLTFNLVHHIDERTGRMSLSYTVYRISEEEQ